ncbi:ribonuclease III [Ancylothrix sp. C2]|nr:ribonuclease III [Ancylothrix sp. D3o]MCT7949297.1 ribonuclease III [Ancylothrix sp. D3o]
MHKILNFRNQQLLLRALTHRSYANENNGECEHNERLEFLGDALLNFLSGEYLYKNHPEMAEDQLTRRRAALVDEKQLARFAEIIGITFKMRLAQGLIKEGGFSNPNLLSSTFEAVVGAYYLDNNSNIEAVRPIVEELFSSVPENVVETRSIVDAKNRFQQWVQANLDPNPPKYETFHAGGLPHAPEFLSKVYVGEKLYGEGKGRSKKDAEKRAAEDALSRVKTHTP